MVYVKIEVGNGYCGCDNTYYEKFDFASEKITLDQEIFIDTVAYEYARENAESYDPGFDDEEEEEEYYEWLECSWEFIKEEEYLYSV